MQKIKKDSISKHISYAEAVRSNTALKYKIDNIPSEEQLANMKILAEKVFEPMRVHFNVPIYVSSFFRSKELNKIVKGSSTSQHMANKGAAVDLDAHVYGKITNKDIYEYILNNLEFDQLINEYPDENGEPAWVHVSYNEGNNRKQVIINLSK